MTNAYKINKNVILQKMDNNLVGFDADRSFLYTFNETGELVFRKIKLGWKEERIIQILAQKYNVPLPTLKKDVKTLIRDMIKNKIIYSIHSK